VDLAAIAPERGRAAGRAPPLPRIGTASITPQTVAQIVQASAVAGDFGLRDLGGHNLKRGALTTGFEFGVHPTKLMRPCRHKSCELLERRRVTLSGRPSPPYDLRMDHVTLPPELEQFAAEAVAAGRYRDVSEVVQAGLCLLQRAETDAAEFVASLERARAEGERDGFLTTKQVEQRVRAAIKDAVAQHG
jgi:putative addiction module CopG family antidote